jgi:hypothetical protein
MHGGETRQNRPFFLLSLLLVAVMMTVSNIQGVIDMMPTSHHHEDQHRVEKIMKPSSKLLSPSASKQNFAIHELRMGDKHQKSSIPLAQQSEDPSLQIVPHNDNTVITIVSIGKLVDRFSLEECIRSIRKRGRFTGYILVFTDSKGVTAYRQSMRWDPKTKLVKGWEEDMQPMENVTRILGDGSLRIEQRPIQYAQNTMIFKRFKTHHRKYVEADPDLANTTRFILYVDVDIVISNPLDMFFQDYVGMVQSEHLDWMNNLTDIIDQPREFSFISMFRDKHLKSKMHGGIILFDLWHENGCSSAWRKEMDEFWHVSDQIMMLNVIGNYSSYHCRVFALPQQHFNFANKRTMEHRTPKNLPTFVHVTDFRIKRMNNATLHQEFLRFILDIKEGENMMEGASWEQIIAPDAARAAVT